MMPDTVRTVFRNGFAPALPTRGLEALAEALLTDDPRVLQGATTSPPPLAALQNRDCEAGCPVSFVGMNTGLSTVADVESFFADVCFAADSRIDAVAACRHFLNWVDDTPRNQMREALLVEVNDVLATRAAAVCDGSHK